MTNPNIWTDRQIISRIKDPDTRDKTLYALFYQLDWRGAAIALVRKLGGNEQDGEELASDALVAFDHNVRNDRFQGKSALKTYFLSIARYRWLNHLRRQRPGLLPLAENLEGREDESAEMIFLREEYSEVFRSALAMIGDRCQKILELYMLDTRMEEIARAMNLANADMAKKAAYRCRMTMREFLQAHPAWLDRLRED
ncbi:MAG: hypothetical protein RI973_1527 [Bacteroidota bacterium]|jgi:RNA polymerase sigma factor (sigma-70 family)